MNPVDIINWTRAPPEKVLLMRVSKSSRGKVPITKTRIRYLPISNQDIYDNLFEMLRSMRVSVLYQPDFDDALSGSTQELWFDTLCRKSQEMNDGTVDIWLFWTAGDATDEDSFELYYTGKEAVNRIQTIAQPNQKHCFLFHVKAVETKIKTQ
mgnify:FL=1